MSVLSLSQRTPDLLDENTKEKQPEHWVGAAAEKKTLEAPSNASNVIPHELMAPDSRMHQSIGNLVNAKRLLLGNGQAEQMILELNSAAQINRGPDGVFESSRLHWDMLLGRDSEIHPSDYLNFDAKMRF